MVFCPLGRRSRRPKPDPSQPHITVSQTNTDSGPDSRVASADPDARPRRTSRKLTKRNSAQDRPRSRDAVTEKTEKDLAPPLDPITPMSPMGSNLFHLPPAMNSREDITALPQSRELRTSPHLRPVVQDNDGIPYDFRLHSSSSNIPPSRNGRLQRNPSGSKRAAADPLLPRRKSSKKRKDDHVREEEIRAMSAPIPIPRYNSSGILRKDSKKARGGLNKHFERPMSNVSLPTQESIHSSLSGRSESRNYRVSIMAVVAPRPTLRYHHSSPYVSTGMSQNTWTTPSRSDSRKGRRPIPSSDVMKASRTVDGLADDLDSGELRDLMDRDRRRRERKRKNEAEKLKRKLERKAEKQRKKELLEHGQAGAGAAMLLPEAKDTDVPDYVGLGIDSRDLDEAESPVLPAVESHSRMHETADTAAPASYRHPQEEIPDMPAFETADEPDSRAGSSIDMHLDDDPIAPGPPHHKYTPADVSPPASPVRVESGTATISVTGTGTLSRPTSIPQSYTTVDPNPPSPGPRRDSETKRRMFAALFRRDQTRRKLSTDTGKSTPPSEPGFAKVSRDYSTHQPSSAHHFPTAKPGSRSATPARTQSKFREDLPELPLSPPDSRVQSPESTTAGARAIAARQGHGSTGTARPDSGAQRLSNPFDDSAQVRTDSPVSGRGLVSQSLASVDSEASWLSGRPMNRLSKSRMRHQSGASSVARAPEEFSTSHEDIHDDEYFSRFSPQPDEHRRGSTLSDIIGHKASSTAIAPVSGASDSEDEGRPSTASRARQQTDGETVIHIGPSRHATVHHRDIHVRSSEGLLKKFVDAGEEAQAPATAPPPSEAILDSPIVDDDDDDDDEDGSTSIIDDADAARPAVRRATSINLGRGHARTMSAGSAKLLEIPKRNSHHSATGLSSNRGSQTMSSEHEEAAQL